MSRRAAFIATRKFHFSGFMIEGKIGRRAAYAIATKRAAEYVFRATSHNLNTISVAVW